MTMHKPNHEMADKVGARILLVDDDERNLLALGEVLQPIADVVTASSGRDALRLLLREEFAVILLDVFMPGMDGYETASLIRSRSQTAHIPIIFLSAVNKETEHLMRGYEMGAVDYVFKPVEPLVLKSKVGVFVDLYRMRRTVEDQALAEQQLREAHFQEQLNRIEAERQLAESERRQANILRALPMAVYETLRHEDGSEKQTFVGGDLAYFLGDEAEHLSSGKRSWKEWIHDEDIKMVERQFAFDDLESPTVEYRLVRPDGSIRYLLDQRVRMPSDGPSRWAGTLIDISDRKALEAQLVHVGKLDALGQLTGGIAHDFNNLLAALAGGLHVLERRLTLGDRERRIVDQMGHAVSQGAELVRRMMAFARSQDLHPTRIDAESLCETVSGLVSHAMGGMISIDWQCPADGPNIYADRGQLELALMNLIINGRDAMPDGGTIRVTITPVDGDQGARLSICVRDEGHGIPRDSLAKVTEPFFTTKEVGKGTGLGLSMVSGFVHQSGGEMRIESEVGTGTTVELLLPAMYGEGGPEPGTISPSLDWMSEKHLLLVDDDDTVRELLAEQFREAGGIVEAVASGQEAISLVGARPDLFDYIISDFAMPGLNGAATLHELRKIATKARFALMTGFADDISLQAQDIAILQKPIDLRKLRSAFM